MQNDPAGFPVIEVLHLDAALRAIQFVLIILFRGKYLLVHARNRREFLGRKNFVVMLDNFFEFARSEPLAFALGTDLNQLTIVFDGVKCGMASGAIHRRQA